MRSLTLSSILKDLLNNTKTALESIKAHTAALASQEKVVTKLQNYQDGLEQKFNDTKKQAADALIQHNSSTNAHSDIRAAISSNNEAIRQDKEQAQANLNAHNTSSTAHQDIRNQMATLSQKHTDDMAALRQDLSTVYHYKSSVNSYSDLPKSGMKVGDTYNIQTKDDAHNIRPGDNVSWNGTDWDNLSGIVDLSWLLPKSGGVITGDLSVQGSLHANADTVNKLKTARNINFNGALDGNVTFDGSKNVSVTLSEFNHIEAIIDLTDATKYDADTYYPVVSNVYWGDREDKYRCWTPIHAVKTAPWGTFGGGTGDYSADLKVRNNMYSWGSQKAYAEILMNSCLGTTNGKMPITYRQMGNCGRSVFFVRGGGKYWFSSTRNATWELKTDTFTENGNTVALTKTYFTPESRNTIKTVGINISGNAATASKVTATTPVNGSVDLVYGTMADSDAARIHISGANNKGELELATSDDGDETIVARQYRGNSSDISFANVAREAYILNSEGNTSFPGTVTAPRFSGVLNGNAATASKLATPRTLILEGGVTGSTTFDGSSNVTINATVTQSANAATADAAATIKNFERGTANVFRNVWFSDSTNNAKPVYNEGIQYNPSTNVLKAGTFQGALNGNADTATDADKLDGHHENAFLRAREDASSNQENTLWDQIGIKQYAKKLPDGLTDVYNFGAVVSLPSSQSRLDLWYADHNSQGLAYRTGWVNNKRDWKRILDSASFNEFAPKLDGTGAKGTWNINISGTSERSNYINTQEVGHTDNIERRIFVSGSGDNTIQCYDPNMTYNSSTQTLTVKAVNGTAAKASRDAAGNMITDTYETKANVDTFMNGCTVSTVTALWN